MSPWYLYAMRALFSCAEARLGLVPQWVRVYSSNGMDVQSCCVPAVIKESAGQAAESPPTPQVLPEEAALDCAGGVLWRQSGEPDLSSQDLTPSPQKCSSHADLDKEYSRWLRFELRDSPAGRPSIVVGFTGDTRYEESLLEHLASCDVVVAHLSTMEDVSMGCRKIHVPPEDVIKQVRRSFPGFEGHYKSHLGFWGVARLLAGLYRRNPLQERLIVIGEFGEELAHERLAVVKWLDKAARVLGGDGREVTDWPIRLIASDVGTRVGLAGREQRGEALCQFAGMVCTRAANTGSPDERLVGIADPGSAHLRASDVAIAYYCDKHAQLLQRCD